MMLTEWGKQLDKSCPLSEYPRPQFVRDSYLSLNGMWQCAFTRDSTVPVQMDTAICVPYSPETPLTGEAADQVLQKLEERSQSISE